MRMARSRGDQPTATQLNGTQPLATPTPTDNSARPPGHTFDLDGGRFALSPRMAWSILTAAIVIGAGIAATHFRLGSIETTITEIKVEMGDDRSNAQTKQQAYIDCLEQERANPGSRCALAKAGPPIVIAPKAKPRSKVAVKEPPGLFDWLPFGTPALAKGK